jgi:hypothetical protein
MVLGDAINGGSYREGDRWESKRKRKKSEGVREKGIEVHSKVRGVDSITRCVCVQQRMPVLLMSQMGLEWLSGW